MDGELSVDNILAPEEVEALFEDTGTEETPPADNKEEQPAGQEEEKKEKETTEVVDVDALFTDKPESVSSGKENNQEEKEDTTSTQDDGTSPNFYSSIAKALKEEGILPDLDDKAYSKVKTPEDFRDLIEQKIHDGLDERQKRIDEALNAGVEQPVITQYENTLKYLDKIDETALSDEGEQGENLRRQIIYQDFINRGFSKERADREVKRSFDAGNDVDDAKDALESNKDFFKTQYQDIVKNAQAEDQKIEQERKEQASKLKTSILEDQKVFGEIEVDKTTRQKVYDNISKPIYKDPETGDYLTAIQKYERDNSTDFLKNVGLIFTLTDGFKNLNGLVKGKVSKEVKKGLRELESTINNTQRTSDGNLKLVSGVDEDPESFIGKGYKLDI